MPPARRRPPVGSTRPPAGSIRRPKVAGRSGQQPGTEQSSDAVDTPDVVETSPEAPVDGKPAADRVDDPAAADRVDDPAATGRDSAATTSTVGGPTKVDLGKSDAPSSAAPSTERPAADPGPADASPVAPGSGSATSWWTSRTKMLAVVAAVFAVVTVVAVVKPGTSEVSNAAWVDTSATLEVTAAARDALQTVFSYKFDTIDEDQEAARAVLSDDRREEYDSTAEQTKQGVIQTQTTTTSTVTDIGVSLLEGDRAELVASMDVAANQEGVDQGVVQTPVALTMERVDGTWLLATIDNR